MTNDQNPPRDRPAFDSLTLQVLDNLFEGCQVLDFELRYLYLNHQAAGHARRPREELLGNRMVDLYPGIDQTEMYEHLQRCLSERVPVQMENRFRYEDGLERVFSLRMDPVPQGVFILSEDITDRRLSEDNLRKSEAMLSRAEQIAGIGNWHWAYGRDEVTWSSGLFRILGMDPAQGAPPFADQKRIYHPEDWGNLTSAVERAIQEGRHYVVPARMRRRDGTYRHCIIRGYPEKGSDDQVDQLYGVVQDVTDLLALQEQAEQRHRLESIGALAGGVAHDFNNLLMAQMGFCDLALEDLARPDVVEMTISQIRGCAERAATLTRQLLAFSRKQAMRPVVMDVNTVVGDMEPLLRRLIGENVILETHLSEETGSVLADPGQVEQIIMNLVVNSRDAMPGGGHLTIETFRVILDDDYVAEHEGATPGSNAVLAISDTGKGMDEDTCRHIFEPFFTTKERGQGTGMGLAMVYGIVKQSGGNIWVYSEEGGGTTMKVYLPSVEEEARPRPQASFEETRGGGERVLVVEDDPGVAELLEMQLLKLGYEVHVAPDGEQGLAMVVDQGLEPQLLLTDVVMPGMGGGELARRAQEHLPGLLVLFISGYTENTIVHQGVLDPGVAFLQKPFNFEVLATAVRRVLDGEENPTG